MKSLPSLNKVIELEFVRLIEFDRLTEFDRLIEFARLPSLKFYRVSQKKKFQILSKNFQNSNFSGNLRIAFHGDFHIMGEKFFQLYFWREYTESLRINRDGISRFAKTHHVLLKRS